MRMRELAIASDLPRTTIHHYLREGLLPEPQRTAANAATYGPEHLARLKLLKALRGPELGPLPVGQIRRVLVLLDEGHSPTEAVELAALGRRASGQTDSVGGAVSDAGSGAMNLRELARRTGRDTRELRQLIDGGLLAPQDETGSRGFDATDIAAVESCACLLDAGIEAADLAPLAELLAEVKGYEKALEELATSAVPQSEVGEIRRRLRGAFRDLRVYVMARQLPE